MTYIPFSGSGPTVNSLLGEHVTAMFAEYPAVAEQIKAGKLRALATASPARMEALPELPTVAESGYPGFEVDVWWGAFAPAGTPKEIVSRLSVSFTAAVQAPEVKASSSRSALSRRPVARISPPTCAGNMTNMAGSSRRRTSEG